MDESKSLPLDGDRVEDQSEDGKNGRSMHSKISNLLLLLKTPPFFYFLAVRFCLLFAIQMQSLVVAWQIYDLTQRPSSLGYAGLIQFLPAAVFSVLGGQIADRYDRKKMAVFCHLGLAATSLLLLLLPVFFKLEVWPYYLCLALIGTCRSLGAPSTQALLPNLVPENLFSSAVAINSMVMQASILIAPSLGGALLGLADSFYPGKGAPHVFALCATLIIMSIFALLRIRSPKFQAGKPGGGLTFIIEGFYYLQKNKALLGAISLDLFAVLLGGSVALLPVYARDILHAGPLGLGLLRSSTGVGAFCMAMLLLFVPLKRHAGRWMFGSVFLFGLATMAFAYCRQTILSVIFLFVMGASDMISVVVRSTLVQLRTPDSMRGRVSSVSSLFIMASNELGEFESGMAAATLGTELSVMLGGLGTCFIVFLWSHLFPELKRFQSLEKTEAHEK